MAAGDVEVGIDQIAEVAVPFDALGVAVGRAGAVLRRAAARRPEPRPGAARGGHHADRPSPDFEQIMWDV